MKSMCENMTANVRFKCLTDMKFLLVAGGTLKSPSQLELNSYLIAPTISKAGPDVNTQVSSDTYSGVKSEPSSDSESETDTTASVSLEPDLEPPEPEFVACPDVNSLQFGDKLFDEELEKVAVVPVDPLADAELFPAAANRLHSESELPVLEEGDCVSGLAVAVMQNEIDDGDSFPSINRATNVERSSAPLSAAHPANASMRPSPPEAKYRAVEVTNPVESFETVRDALSDCGTPQDVIVFRCSLGSDDDCKAWIQEFEASTKTKWIVQYSTTELKSLDFKKVFKCHLASHGKTKNFSIRNLQCPARVIMKIKKFTASNFLNDVYFQRPAPLRGEVVIEDTHNHSLDISLRLRLLRPSADVRALFEGYFRDGMSCSVARHSHRAALRAAGYSEDGLTDMGVNPSYKTVRLWYRAWETEKFGS